MPIPMSTDPTGSKTLQVLHDLHAQGVTNYVVLMRHADRPIDHAGNDLAMQISEEGRRDAYAFGRALPCDGLKRFYASPIDRCVETATLIAKGCQDTGGETSPKVTVMDALFAFFVRDVERADGLLYETFGQGDPYRFFRDWFDGNYPPEMIDDAAQAARAQLDALLPLLQGPPAGNICVSHDINLFLIKNYYLGLRPEDHEYIQFLEGVVIYEQDGEYYIVNHQAGAKKLPLSQNVK